MYLLTIQKVSTVSTIKQYFPPVGTIYINSSANVKLEKPGTGPTFPIEKGVIQGDPRCTRFTIFLKEVFKKLTQSWEDKNTNFGSKK